jgi:hypothetical protein
LYHTAGATAGQSRDRRTTEFACSLEQARPFLHETVQNLDLSQEFIWIGFASNLSWSS